MKPISPLHARPAVTLLVAGAALAGAVHCTTSTTNHGSAFVGTWSCPASLSAFAQTLSITENLDDSLSLSAGSDAGASICQSDLWTYSGSTATMNPGTSCTVGPNGDELLSVNSLTLAVSGTTLTVTVKESMSSQAVEADGGVGAVTKSALSLSGACTKQ